MNLQPSKNFVLDAIDEKKEHTIYAGINFFFGVLALLIFSAGYYPITCVAIFVIAIINGIKSVNWVRYDKNKITDLTRNILQIREKMLVCCQSNGSNAYEECNICLEEVDKVIESTEKGNSGFYVYLSDDSYRSEIYINNIMVNQKIFFVRGMGYETDDFIELYRTCIKELNPDTTIIGSKTQEKWKEKTRKQELKELLMPWVIVSALIITSHLILTLFIS